MIAALALAAHAAVTTKTGTICLEFTTNFSDLGGDFWTTNADRPARGVKIEVTDASSTDAYWLDDETGCLDVNVDVELNNGTFQLRAVSEARVEGVELESWRGENTDSASFHYIQWNIQSGPLFSYGVVTRDLPWNQRWANLAVGTFAFHQFTFGMGTGGTRGCCLEDRDGYEPDGTCTDSDTGYVAITTPVQFQVDPDPEEGNECCFSHLIGTGNPPGVRTDESTDMKFVIAHELGHVIAGMRMGGKEFGEYNENAPEDGCKGSFDDSAEPDDLPLEDFNTRFSKEYVAGSLREGWGNFVAAVVWNDRTQSDCVYHDSFAFCDFDLDGVFDNDHPTNNALDGQYDCEGTPNLWGTFPGWLSSENWLEDLEDADDDNVDDVQCVEDGNAAREDNRTSVYDVTRMLWDLTTDQGLSPAELTDLYIDACPRGWSEWDAPSDAESCTNGVDDGDADALVDCLDPSCATHAACADALPLERLWLSALEHGLTTELDAELGHLEH